MKKKQQQLQKPQNTAELTDQANSTLEALFALVFGASRGGSHKRNPPPHPHPGDVECVNSQANSWQNAV